MLTKADRRRKIKSLEDIRRQRIENVRALCALYPSISDFARAIGQDPSLYHAIAGENPRRAIGEALARNIEQVLKLPLGWLDQPH